VAYQAAKASEVNSAEMSRREGVDCGKMVRVNVEKIATISHRRGRHLCRGGLELALFSEKTMAQEMRRHSRALSGERKKIIGGACPLWAASKK